MSAPYLERPTDWMEQAACRAQPLDLFFPEGRPVAVRLQTARAKAVCATCRVQAPCLDFARTTGQQFGIWGGRTSAER